MVEVAVFSVLSFPPTPSLSLLLLFLSLLTSGGRQKQGADVGWTQKPGVNVGRATETGC